jgi:hypothetical protein
VITGPDILAALVSGEIDETTIIEAVKEYRRGEHARKVLAARTTLKVGTRCTVNGIRPKRLCGTIGTIDMLNGNRAALKVESSPDWHHAAGSFIHGIPIVCLTPTGTK